MALPSFTSSGDLPVGVHRATMEEIVARFGSGTLQRQAVTARLQRIYELAQRTGKLERCIIFGSYVTSKPAPNDVDVILVMRDDFRLSDCDRETMSVFDHDRADAELRASVFWVRPTMLFLETMEEFTAAWQTTREKTRRGIVEVQP
jgi:hypothetical protein